MAAVDPIPGEPAAVADLGGERALVIADYHAGYESALRYERGIDVPSQAAARRERIHDVLERVKTAGAAVDRLVVLGDFMHSIGGPGGAERGEIEVLLESLPELPVTVVKGNHDGAIESWVEGVDVTEGDGARIGDVGFVHGHTWPAPAVLSAPIVCVGHEHPCVRLEDEVGGVRIERAWLRGELDPAPFLDQERYDEADLPWAQESQPTDGESAGTDGVSAGTDGESAARGGEAPSIVVVPAFNDLVGGTWVNVPGQEFLAPFLPAALHHAEAYLLDGTRLGAYDAI